MRTAKKLAAKMPMEHSSKSGVSGLEVKVFQHMKN